MFQHARWYHVTKIVENFCTHTEIKCIWTVISKGKAFLWTIKSFVFCELTYLPNEALDLLELTIFYYLSKTFAYRDKFKLCWSIQCRTNVFESHIFERIMLTIYIWNALQGTINSLSTSSLDFPLFANMIRTVLRIFSFI